MYISYEDMGLFVIKNVKNALPAPNIFKFWAIFPLIIHIQY